MPASGHLGLWLKGQAHRAKPYSDLDLAIITHTPLTLAQMADLADTFRQSDLPIQVDLLDWAGAQPGIRQAIERERAIVWQASQAT